MGEGEEQNQLLEFVDFKFHVLNWYEYLVYCFAAAFCVIFAVTNEIGLMSGLTLGLLSFEPMSLKILIQTGEGREKKRAKKIMKLIKHHHWLLCTLLIANAVAMEALPIFLDALVPATVAILISVTCILLFGEIIPQALCSRYGLIIGYYTFYLVAFLMIVTFPISFPLSKLLDCILGKAHLTFYRRDQLKSLVSLHGEGMSPLDPNELPLTKDEITVIRGALEMSNKTVSGIMTSMENVYMLPLGTILDFNTLEDIEKKGHSRIPIFKEDKINIVGLLLVKNLITVNPEHCIPLEKMEFRTFPIVEEDMNVWDMLNIFQEGKSHMAMVVSCTENRERRIKTIIHTSSGSDDSSRDEEEGDPDVEAKKLPPEPIILPSPDAKVFSDFQEFKMYKKHYERNHHKGGEILGVVTLEDVIEELIQEEIIDETDEFLDVNKKIRIADAYRRISRSISISSNPMGRDSKMRQTKSELERILDERVATLESPEKNRSFLGNEVMSQSGDRDFELRGIPQEVIEIREKVLANMRIPPMKEILKKKASKEKVNDGGDKPLLAKKN